MYRTKQKYIETFRLYIFIVLNVVKATNAYTKTITVNNNLKGKMYVKILNGHI